MSCAFLYSHSLVCSNFMITNFYTLKDSPPYALFNIIKNEKLEFKRKKVTSIDYFFFEAFFAAGFFAAAFAMLSRIILLEFAISM
jgi:hypothetical protein